MRRRSNAHESIGWILFAIMVAFLFIILMRKKTTPSSVTHQLKLGVNGNPILHWNSLTDPVPSFTEAPPFQNPDGSLVCASGYSLWQDDKNGNLACYKDPVITDPGVTLATNPNSPSGSLGITGSD